MGQPYHWESRYCKPIENLLNCRSPRPIGVCVTSTIHDEVERGLVGYINRMFDKGQIRMYVPRPPVFKQAQERLRQLWSKVGSPLAVKNAKTAEIRSLYSKLAASNGRRLVDRAKYRPGHSLLPSDADLTLVGEAARLADEGERVALLSSDQDFTSFTTEIHEGFGVKILDLFQFPSDTNSILGLLSQV